MLKRRQSPKDYAQGYWSSLNSAEEMIRDQLTKWAHSPEAQDALGAVLVEIHKSKSMAKRMIDETMDYETKSN